MEASSEHGRGDKLNLSERESAVGGTGLVDRVLSALQADSVTVLGASPRVRASAIMVKNLVEGEGAFQGRVNLVSRREAEMFGHPCVGSVADVDAPGLVFCMTSLTNVAASIDSFKASPKGLLLYSEVKTAVDAEALTTIASWTDSVDCALIGPQSAGFVAPGAQLTGWIGPIPEGLIHGSIGLVSQSGGILAGVMRSCGQLGLGLSGALSVGTGFRTDIRTAGSSILEMAETGALGVYAEAIDPHVIAALGSKGAELGKPVVVLATGRSARAREAVLSHVGMAATPHHLLEAVSRQYGVTVVRDVDELVWALDGLVETGCRRGFPDGVVTISSSGGAAVAVTEALDGVGAPAAPLEDSTIKKLENLAGGQSVFNPLDMGAAELGGEYEEILHTLGRDRTVGIVLELSGTGTNVVDARLSPDGKGVNSFLSETTSLGSIVSGYEKMAILSTPASLGHGRSNWHQGVLRVAGSRRTAVVADALSRWSSSLNVEDLLSHPVAQASTETRAGRGASPASRVLVGERARHELRDIPVSWPRHHRLETDEDLDLAIAQLGLPIVLKAEVEAAHRAAVGAVLVDITSDELLAAAVDFLRAKHGCAVVAYEQVARAEEYLVGFSRESGYLVVMCGRGGLQADSHAPLVLAPATARSIGSLIPASVHDEAQRSGLVEILSALQTYSLDHPEILAAEMNPIVYDVDRGWTALDGKIHI